MSRLRLALALALVVTPCLAQEYPVRPVKIIVPFGAGGPADVTARQIGSILQESFGQPFVVENRTGAGGVIGTQDIIYYISFVFIFGFLTAKSLDRRNW